MKKRMMQTCEKHVIHEEIEVVIREPYIPYVPENWNGVLVLAEAQNLSSTNDSYVEKLKRMSSKERYKRLNEHHNDLGIQPWDDGSLKLAIESALMIDADTTAVSNAVVWSQVDELNRNITPSTKLIDLSTKFWTDLLPLKIPEHIVTCGNTAHRVFSETFKVIRFTGQHTKLRLPSKTAMSRVSGMFSKDDLLKRYEEVNEIVKKHPEWTDKFKQNKIFFACHAVSIVKGNRGLK